MEYENEAWQETLIWIRKTQRKQGVFQRLSKQTQIKMQTFIPEKAHKVITDSIKQMVDLSLTSSEYLPSSKALKVVTLQEKEELVRKKQTTYKRLAAFEGAGTGAGGILLGLADFPLLLSIKMRFLFEIGSIYGFDVKEYDERLFILHVFQLAHTSEENKGFLIETISNWDNKEKESTEINWRKWQQDYRDYIDLVKLFQLVPGIGAVVGAYANAHLVNQLCETAMYCYRIRLLKVLS